MANKTGLPICGGKEKYRIKEKFVPHLLLNLAYVIEDCVYLLLLPPAVPLATAPAPCVVTTPECMFSPSNWPLSLPKAY